MKYKLFDIDESYTELETEDNNFKKVIIDTLSVYEEGYQFTPQFRSGYWDGKKRFFTFNGANIRFPKGLVGYIIEHLNKQNIEFEYIKTVTEIKYTFDEHEEFVKSLNIPFKPYDYQIAASHNMITNFRGVYDSATGSGKSLIIYIFLMFMLKNNKKSILVVPSISLTLQMKSDFEDYGLKNSDDLIRLIGGENNDKLFDKQIIISTWQSLQYMNKDEFKQFHSIVIDEAHQLKADVLGRVTSSAVDAKWKVGLTGTVPKPKADRLSLIGTLGKINKVISPGGLIARGLATPVKINMIYLNYSSEEKTFVKKNKKDYRLQDEYICKHQNRNNKVSKISDKLSNSGNVLCLFSKVEHGKLLLKNAIVERTGFYNVDIIDRLTPKHLDEALIKFKENIEIKFFYNGEITKEIFEKIMKYVKKKNISEEFIRSFYSLTDINIYFIYGGVEGSEREEIRRVLETISHNDIVLTFESKKIHINKDELIPLSNGTTKYAKEITENDDVLDEWIEKN